MISRRLFAHELEERLDRLLFASPSHRSIERLAQSLESLPRAQQELALHWAGVAAQTYAEIGYLIASLAPSVLVELSEHDFAAWVLRGLDVYDKQGLRPAMAALRDVEGFRAEREGRACARFSEVEARIGRFVQGLSGRPLAVKSAPTAYTDTETIFLPERIGHFAAREENLRLYRALAVRLWAQTRFGTFRVDLVAALAAHEARETALAWLSWLEAARLEACIARELPGLARELRRWREDWPHAMQAALPELMAPGAEVAVSLAWLDRLMAQGAVPPAPTLLGTLAPEAARQVRKTRIARETEILRRAISSLRAAAGRKGATQGEITLARNETGALEIRLDGEAVALELEAQQAAESLVQDLGTLPPEALTPAGEGAWSPCAANAQGGEPEAMQDRRADHYYDEWDHQRQAYRRGWCHLYESVVKEGTGEFVLETRRRQAARIRQLRKKFEAVRGEERWLSRQLEGEELDLDAVVEAVEDRRSGAEPSPRLFMRRQRNERSLAALFLIDMSGSTKGWVNDCEREALVMLCEALETLGDAYAIYGFSGWTRTRCDLYRIKRFDERYDETVARRIDGIEAKDYTRMGVAIRHVTSLLAAQPARHKLLVLLTDGRPDDFGDEYRGAYGIEDTRRALLEARRQGIRSYCVTIDRAGQEYLKHMMGPAAYTVLDDAGKLPLKIADIYRRLTV